MAEIQTVDLQPIGPLPRIRLLRVARRRVAGEPGRDDQVRARPQELEAGLVADLHATARQQRDPPAQVGELARASRNCSLRTTGTSGRRNDGSSSTSACRCSSSAGRPSPAARNRRRSSSESSAGARSLEAETRGREDIRGREHRLPSQGADAGPGEHALVAVGPLAPPPPRERLRHRAAGANVRIADERCRLRAAADVRPPRAARACHGPRRSARAFRSRRAGVRASMRVADGRRSRGGHAPQG